MNINHKVAAHLMDAKKEVYKAEFLDRLDKLHCLDTLIETICKDTDQTSLLERIANIKNHYMAKNSINQKTFNQEETE